MKTKLLAFLLLGLIISCKDKTEHKINYSNEKIDLTTSIYPENISEVFDAHGGIDSWKSMKSLEFTMNKPNSDEITTTDLRSRKSLINMPNHLIGYNGKDVWLKNKDTTNYKGNAKFYYNLMFYFYAMPFILADDGISYDTAKPLEFEGKTYPGIKISYESGIGESPDDEYILYYNSETYQMEWLAYTVTYFTKEKGKEFHLIKYSNWQEVDGLLVPEMLSWYHYENNVPTTKQNDLHFSNIKFSKEKADSKIFEMPEGAEIIQ